MAGIEGLFTSNSTFSVSKYELESFLHGSVVTDPVNHMLTSPVTGGWSITLMRAWKSLHRQKAKHQNWRILEEAMLTYHIISLLAVDPI